MRVVRFRQPASPGEWIVGHRFGETKNGCYSYVYPPNSILRPKQTALKLGIGRTNLLENFTFKEGGAETVPGTNVRRLRPVRLGLRAVGYVDAEVEGLIEGLRRFRDGGAS
jgi:hypothetical protein